jgi:hypothetical protein
MGPYGGHVADYLSDGTVIRVNDRTTEINRLTETGLTAALTLITAARDLLAAPMQIAPRSTFYPVDATHNIPRGIGENVNTFVMERPDGSRYMVSAPSRHRGDAFATGPDPVVEGLTVLADGLADPATTFGSAAFADPVWKTYASAMTAVLVSLEAPRDRNIVTDGTIPHVGPTTWLFKGDPHTFGTVFPGPASYLSRRCAVLPSAEAATALARLPRALGLTASEVAAGVSRHNSILIWVAGSEAAILYVQAFPLLPEDGALSCIEALSY